MKHASLSLKNIAAFSMEHFRRHVNVKTEKTNRKQQISCWIVWKSIFAGFETALIHVDLEGHMKYN